MSGYIKCFGNGGKNMYFLNKDGKVWDKHDNVLKAIKNKLGFKFHSKPVYHY